MAGRGAAAKRGRGWDVDLPLEELVSWEVLEQFIHEIPGEGPSMVGPSMSDGLNQGLGTDTLPHMGGDASAGSSGPSGHAAVYPGAWHPPLGSQTTAAALAHALGPSWQLQGPCFSAPHLAQTWGAEFLPSVLGGPDEDRSVGALASMELDSPAAGEAGSREHSPSLRGRHQKTRFVWTAELHRSFELAVHTLGVDQAKPQAISLLMNCEGEGAPTRQNIKSHLQKYRLMMVKRSRQPFSPTGAPTGNPAPSCISTFVSDDVPPAAAAGAASANEAHTRGTEQERGDTLARSSDDGAEPAEQKTQSPIDQDVLKEHLARQETNLKVQMDLQTKLHRQLLVQRQLQHQLEHSFSSPDPAAPEESQREWEGDVDPQHWQGMLKLKNSLRERLTKHVVMQQVLACPLTLSRPLARHSAIVTFTQYCWHCAAHALVSLRLSHRKCFSIWTRW